MEIDECLFGKRKYNEGFSDTQQFKIILTNPENRANNLLIKPGENNFLSRFLSLLSSSVISLKSDINLKLNNQQNPDNLSVTVAFHLELFKIMWLHQ